MGGATGGVSCAYSTMRIILCSAGALVRAGGLSLSKSSWDLERFYYTALIKRRNRFFPCGCTRGGKIASYSSWRQNGPFWGCFRWRKKSAQKPLPFTSTFAVSRPGTPFCRISIAGLDRHANFYATAKTMPILTAVVCFLSTQNTGYGLLDRRPKEIGFFNFD